MIRIAVVSDLEGINQIKSRMILDINQVVNPDYLTHIQQDGFLFGDLYTEDEIEDGHNLWLVEEENNQIRGYVRIEDSQVMIDDKNTDWLKLELKDVYFALPHANLGGIAVLPEEKGKGIGSALLNEARRHFDGRGVKYLFSFVPLSPIANMASMRFHERYGFEKVMTSMPEEFEGIHDYQCVMYGKNL